MRGPGLFLFFPLRIGEDQKKGFRDRRCRVFPENIGDEDQKKSLHVRRYRVFTEYIGQDQKKSLRCSR